MRVFVKIQLSSRKDDHQKLGKRKCHRPANVADVLLHLPLYLLLHSTSSSTLPLVQHDVVHGIVAQVLLRVDVEVLQVLRVHLTTPVPEENWHVRKLILCFQFLALGVKTPGPENGIFFVYHFV